MKVEIMHPDNFSFGPGGKEIAALGMSAIGTVHIRDGDGHRYPLALDDERKPFAFVDGKAVPLDREEVGPAVYAALDEACTRLWGNSWNSSVGEIFKINRRTTQRDRVSRNLLPTRILQIISYVASADDGEELAIALLALARYNERFRNEGHVRRYWRNAADIFFGDADREIGIKDRLDRNEDS